MAAGRLIVTSFAMLCAALAYAPSAIAQEDETPLVVVTAIARDAHVDAMYGGIVDALHDAGYRQGETVRLRFEDAGADHTRANELVRRLARERADMVIALTEISARAAARFPLRVPLVVSGVAADVALGLRSNKRARLLTGVIEGDSFEEQFSLIREMVPEAHTVAVPYDIDSKDTNGLLRQISAAARDSDLNVEELPVSSKRGAIAAEIAEFTPMETIVFIDRRLLPEDRLAAVIAAADNVHLPVFAHSEETVVHGAIAALVHDPYNTGRHAGHLAARILAEPATARVPIQRVAASFLVFNRTAALSAGLDVSQDILERRGRLLEWSDDENPLPMGKPPAPPEPEPLGLSEGPAGGFPVPKPQAPNG